MDNTTDTAPTYNLFWICEGHKIKIEKTIMELLKGLMLYSDEGTTYGYIDSVRFDLKIVDLRILTEQQAT